MSGFTWDVYGSYQRGKYAKLQAMQADYDRYQQWRTDTYRRGWVEGQTALVVWLRQGGVLEDCTIDTTPQEHPFSQGWLDGQRDLVARLSDGRVTIRSAAIHLGVISADEK